MATRVHSYSKINLGLAIGPVREDGFHGLVTLYQTLELHDVVTVTARRADAIKIEITTNHPWVPRDARNTAWKMVERGLERLMVAAEVSIHIEKNLPVQGGLGAGSANAAAALIGLEKELGVELGEQARMEVAAAVGSDVPLFLVGGAVLGTGRGEIVEAMPELPKVVCVVAVPEVGVSTPAAFKAWDSKQLDGEVEGLVSAGPGVEEAGAVTGVGLTSHPRPDRLKGLSQAYASAFGLPREISGQLEPGPSGIIPAYGSAKAGSNPEKKQGVSDERQRGLENNLAENILLTLVRTGVENDLRNDFEEVVFPEYPSLRETKRLLMGIETGQAALYAALSGSGSALFGLYRSIADAEAAQQRVQATGVKALITNTLPRAEYWARMFAG